MTRRRSKGVTDSESTGYEQVKVPSTSTSRERRVSISDSVADALPQPSRVAADVKPVVALET